MFLYSEGSPTFLVWGKDIFNGKKRNILFRKIGDKEALPVVSRRGFNFEELFLF